MRQVNWCLLVCVLALAGPAHGQEQRTKLAMEVPGVRRVELVRRQQGMVYELTLTNGEVETHSPEAFAQRLLQSDHRRPWYQRVLNITSSAGIAWVAIGMAGQLLFTGRMLVQWLVSERERRSVVPAAFWWMSLGGGIMLLVYFIWRKDIVGVLGQGLGTVVYLRNLMLIYRQNA